MQFVVESDSPSLLELESVSGSGSVAFSELESVPELQSAVSDAIGDFMQVELADLPY